MGDRPEKRRGPDRRGQPRGGRRAEDREGFSPLVLLVGNGTDVTEKSEAILAKLKFAVSTSETVEDALRVIPDLNPDVVVAGEFEGRRIRAELPANVRLVVTRPGPGQTAETLIDDVLRTVRSSVKTF
jgi:hypothetical protein